MTFRAFQRILWPVLLLASASASAQLAPPPTWIEFVTGENISFSEATWELFTKVAEAEKTKTSDYVAEVTVLLQLTDKQNRDLISLMTKSVKDSNAYATSLRKSMCARRAEFTTPQILARELDRIDEEVLNNRDKLMAGAAPILGMPGMARLEPIVLGVRNGMRVPRINYVEAMREMKETPAAVLTRMCAEFK